MASHFKWYPSESEVVVPFNARYSFPSQANKAIKMTPRIPPKNASEFGPGNVIRLEFPAQGYVNTGKTTLEFDVEMIYDPLDSEYSKLRFQNNIQSIFSRVRLLYGATSLEDIPDYNVIVRCLTEWTGTNNDAYMDQTSISEGIGGKGQGFSGQFGNGAANAGARTPGAVNFRQKYIQGIDFAVRDLAGGAGDDNGGFSGFGLVPNSNGVTTLDPGTNATPVHQTVRGKYPTRRYQVQLLLGVMMQEKLLPTKFMASQLAIEITLANANTCMYFTQSPAKAAGTPTNAYAVTPQTKEPTYKVKNVNLIPEVLEFDASYDESFLKGLQNGGVPIKFATWNNYGFSSNGVSSFNMQIQERSRSVKAIFCVQRRDPPSFSTDSGATFFNTALGGDGTGIPNGACTFNEYQFRIGSRYFPAQPVQCSTEVGGKIPNGGSEAYVELAKALNTLGDYRLSSSANTARWAVNPGVEASTIGLKHNILPEFDYDYGLVSFKYTGSPVVYKSVINTDNITSQSLCGDLGSSCFAMAIDLETSNGLEISGLNAEEQSDISLIARFSDMQSAGFLFNVFTYIDSMIVLRENNVLFILTFRLWSLFSKMCVSFNKWEIMV